MRGALPDYYFLFLCSLFFPVQQTKSGVGHHVKYSYFFFGGGGGLATNNQSNSVECEKQQLFKEKQPGKSRVYQVTQMRTDDVNCREYAGAGLLVLKVVPVTGAAFSGVTIDHFLCVSLFPHSLLVKVGT